MSTPLTFHDLISKMQQHKKLLLVEDNGTVRPFRDPEEVTIGDAYDRLRVVGDSVLCEVVPADEQRIEFRTNGCSERWYQLAEEKARVTVPPVPKFCNIHVPITFPW